MNKQRFIVKVMDKMSRFQKQKKLIKFEEKY